MFGSILGSIAGPVVGGLFGLGGSKQQNRYGEANAAAAVQANRENFQNRHQWEVEDLRKAGLNPMLSANQGGSVAASPMAPPPNVAGNVASATQAALLSAQLKNIKADTQKKTSEAWTADNIGAKNAMETEILRKQMPAVTSSVKSDVESNQFWERINRGLNTASAKGEQYIKKFKSAYDKEKKFQQSQRGK